jgi:hypothetical protein
VSRRFSKENVKAGEAPAGPGRDTSTMLKMTLNSSGLGDGEGKQREREEWAKILRRQRPFKGCERRGVLLLVVVVVVVDLMSTADSCPGHIPGDVESPSEMSYEDSGQRINKFLL